MFSEVRSQIFWGQPMDLRSVSLNTLRAFEMAVSRPPTSVRKRHSPAFALPAGLAASGKDQSLLERLTSGANLQHFSAPKSFK